MLNPSPCGGHHLLSSAGDLTRDPAAWCVLGGGWGAGASLKRAGTVQGRGPRGRPRRLAPGLVGRYTRLVHAFPRPRGITPAVEALYGRFHARLCRAAGCAWLMNPRHPCPALRREPMTSPSLTMHPTCHRGNLETPPMVDRALQLRPGSNPESGISPQQHELLHWLKISASGGQGTLCTFLPRRGKTCC